MSVAGVGGWIEAHSGGWCHVLMCMTMLYIEFIYFGDLIMHYHELWDYALYYDLGWCPKSSYECML